MVRTPDYVAGRNEPVSEIDLRAIGSALRRRRRVYVMPTILAFVLIVLYVNVATKRYTAQTQILLENQETFFTRPDRVSLPVESISQLDEAAVASQVQLIGSPDLARRVISQLKLVGNDEFDPLAHLDPLSRALMLVGLLPDPSRDSADARVVETFLQRLTVYSPPKTRVVTIEFTSRDAALASRVANTIADLYIQEQSATKRRMAQSAAEALSAQIDSLRLKLARADAEREQYRSTSGLLAGTNNMTISGQQLADINSDLSKARSLQADSQAKASLIRELLRNGQAVDVAEVTNNEIVRRIWDQRSQAQAQLAFESRTLLPAHPRIKELTAQVAQYETTLKAAARQAATSLENEAKIAGQRVANLEAVLNQQKKAVGVANGDEVHLRALERVAQSLKDQLESSTTKYEEAVSRQSSTATPADARIISRAVEPQRPSYPKKVPFVVFGTLATLVFSIGYVVSAEILSGRASVGEQATPPSDDARQGVLPFDAHPVLQTAAPRSERREAKERQGGRRDANETASRVMPAQAAPPEPASPVEPMSLSWIRQKLVRSATAPGDDDADEVAFAPVVHPQAARQPADGLSTRRVAAALGGVMAYLKQFGRSAAQTRFAAEASHPQVEQPMTESDSWDRKVEAPSANVPQTVEVDTPVESDNLPEIVDRIVGSHVPGRGLHLVGTCVGPSTSPDRLIALGRLLAAKGRSLMVDLGTTPIRLAPLSDLQNGRVEVMTMRGLSELLSGEASFAEVIRRDCASRLHFIPTGLHEADFRDFDLILDALSETYDFVVLLTPAYPQSEVAKVIAPYADFVVLIAPATPGDDVIRTLTHEMIEAGARDVLVVEPHVTALERDVA